MAPKKKSKALERSRTRYSTGAGRGRGRQKGSSASVANGTPVPITSFAALANSTANKVASTNIQQSKKSKLVLPIGQMMRKAKEADAKVTKVRETRGSKAKKTEKALQNQQLEDYYEFLDLPPEDPDDDFVPESTPPKPGRGKRGTCTAANYAPLQWDYQAHLSRRAAKEAAAIAPPIFFPKTDFLSTISRDVHQISEELRSASPVSLELPDIIRENSIIPGEEVTDPYTSKMLFHLYLLAYARRDWFICDLVVDVWIREFHRIDGSRGKIWRTNRCEWVQEKETGEKILQNIFTRKDKDGRETNEAKEVKVKIAKWPDDDNGNPDLDVQVSSFDFERLRELYENTLPGNGARNLWADAMALCGSGLETKLTRPELSRDRWPEEMVWDVMKTSLRLSRVRRTLRIEEKDPKSWCKRYHEHEKHGISCYRDIRVAQDQAEDEEEEELAKLLRQQESARQGCVGSMMY